MRVCHDKTLFSSDVCDEVTCSGSTNTCVLGTCYCGSIAACSGTTDTCTSGTCYCGSAAACTANSDTCTSSACKCGSDTACGTADTISNICSSSTCKCGTATKCTSTVVLSKCLAADLTTPTSSDTAATCKVTLKKSREFLPQ